MSSKSQLSLARRLRNQSTKAEQIMWRVLRNRQLDGYKFYRQVPLGDYVVDFCCKSQQLIIEIDGGIHVGREIQDQEREKSLEKLGFQVIRFTNDQVNNDLNQVVEVIRASLSMQK
jgi:5-methyltetrahydrofolate--homocysteine methyltransferase